MRYVVVCNTQRRPTQWISYSIPEQNFEYNQNLLYIYRVQCYASNTVVIHLVRDRVNWTDDA